VHQDDFDDALGPIVTLDPGMPVPMGEGLGDDATFLLGVEEQAIRG
jgi:hypothetical protein